MPEQATSEDWCSPIAITPIGHVETGYLWREEVPPQARENPAESGRVVVYDAYQRALLGLPQYSYIWLLTWLHAQPEEEARLLQVEPRGLVGTGQLRGVFATRAPCRPSRLGLSLVQLTEVSGCLIRFRGVDLLHGTPVLDIKPWVRGTDSPPSG